MSASCARGAPTVRARRSRSAGFRAAYEAPSAFAADSAVRSSRAFAACAGDASDRASSSAVSASDAYEECAAFYLFSWRGGAGVGETESFEASEPTPGKQTSCSFGKDAIAAMEAGLTRDRVPRAPAGVA